MSKKVKVTVMKTYVVDGKKMGKSAALYLDPEEMARYSTAAMVKKRVMEAVADARVFAPADLRDLKFDMKDFMKEWRAELKKLGVRPLPPISHCFLRAGLVRLFVHPG